MLADEQKTTEYRSEPPNLNNGRAMRFHYASGSRPLDGYTIKRGIGIGGFGEVYFAISDAGKQVALKRVMRNVDIELRGVTQCINLKHINLIDLYDIRYDDQGDGWVVMEYVAGDSLKDVLDRNPKGLPPGEVQAWFRGIAAGVEYLHDHGIVHRDLKPANVFHELGVVKIGDYGLSKFISSQSRSQQTGQVGTFHYMAPEIGNGSYGKEIDIYALGVMLFEMATGELPFDGESSQEIIMRHLTDTADTSDLPPQLKKIVDRALRKDPKMRFRNVGEMVAMLDRNPLPHLVRGNEETADLPTIPRSEIAHYFDDLPDTTPLPKENGKPEDDNNESKAEAVEPTHTEVKEEPKNDSEPFVIDESSPGQVVSTPPMKNDSDVLVISDDSTHAADMVLGNVSTTGKPPLQRSPSHSTNGASQPVVERPSYNPVEPVTTTVSTTWGAALNWWRQSKTGVPIKVGMLFVIFIAMVLGSRAMIPFGLLVGVLCGVFYGVYSLALWVMQRDNPPATELVEEEKNMRAALGEKEHQWNEFFVSLLAAGGASVVLAILMLVLAGVQLINPALAAWAMLSWLVFTLVISSAVILGFGKLWETFIGNSLVRRCALFAAGAVVGGVFFVASLSLGTPIMNEAIAHADSAPALASIYPPVFYGENGMPTLAAFLVQFALLFGFMHWWKLADPLRRTRFSMWAVILAMVFSLFLPLPQPWGLMIAGGVSIAVQLVSRFADERARKELATKA